MKHLLDCALAQTSSGLLVANVTHVSGAKNPREALNEALALGRRVLVAVVLTPEEAEQARLKLDGAAAEIVATLYRALG